MKKLSIKFLILFFMLITISFGATCQGQTDTTHEDISKVFTRVEVSPSFKAGKDSLNNYLTQYVIPSHTYKHGKFILRFIVSSKGNVYEVTREFGNQNFAAIFENAIRKSSGQWNSGMQNGHPVNAYCELTITLKGKKIQAVIK